MSRSLHADFVTRYAVDDQGIIFNAVKIETTVPIYISNAYDEYTIDGNVYTPYAQLLKLPTFDEWPLNSAGLNITIANFDDFFSLISNEYVSRIVVTIYEVLADDAGAVVNYRSIFVGRLDNFGWGEEWATMTIRPGSSLGSRQTPRYIPTCWRRFGGVALGGSRFSCIYDGARLTAPGTPCLKTYADCGSMVFAAAPDGGNSGLVTLTTGGDYDPAVSPHVVTVRLTVAGTEYEWFYDAETPTAGGTLPLGPVDPSGDGWLIYFDTTPGTAGDFWTFQVNNRVNFGGERFCPKVGESIIFRTGTETTSFTIPESNDDAGGGDGRGPSGDVGGGPGDPYDPANQTGGNQPIDLENAGGGWESSRKDPPMPSGAPAVIPPLPEAGGTMQTTRPPGETTTTSGGRT